MKRLILFFLFSLLAAFRLIPEEGNIKFERISIEDGLSQSTVSAIIQDQKGFMWFATQEGLNRYDGYEFKIYWHQPENPNSLSHDVLMCLLEDQKGKLWIGTFHGGLNRFDPISGVFTRYQNDPHNPHSLSHNYVRSIREDSSGRLWIGTEGGGLNVLIPPTGSQEKGKHLWAPDRIRFLRFRHDPQDPNSLSHNIVPVIYEDMNRDIWIGTEGGGLNKVTGNTLAQLKFKRYTHDAQNPKSLSDNNVQAIFEDSAGMLWIGTKYGGLNRFNRQDEIFSHYKNIPNDPTSLSHNNVTAIIEDLEGVLWIGTYGGGLNSLPPAPEREQGKLIFKHHHNNINNPYSLSENFVWNLYVDGMGALWIGTASIGLNKYDRKRYKFRHYTIVPNEVNILESPVVRAIFQDSWGLLWIGSNGGLTCFDRDTGQFTIFRGPGHAPNRLSNDVVRTIYEDREGRLWIGTHGGGLNRLILEHNPPKKIPKGKFVHYRHQPGIINSLSHDEVLVIKEDRWGALWIGTNGGGVDQFFPGPGKFVHYKASPNGPGSLSNNFIRTIWEDSSGTLWLGTNGGGLNRFNREKGDFTVFKHDANNPNSLSNNYVFSIYESPAAPGILWIGTYGGGLNKFDIKTGTFVHYHKKNGLPNNVINGIMETLPPNAPQESTPPKKIGNLWLSTNKGLCEFNPEIGVINTYGVGDGLQSNEFNAGAFFQNRKGEMFFGGINGFNIFSPGTMEPNKHIPPVVLTDFRIFHQPITTLPGPLTELKEIRLKHNENFFSFKFSALDFTDPSKNQYSYRLKGVDKYWIFCDAANRQASYTKISPGEYTFQVRGSNNDAIWNTDGLSIKVTITPPFWDTWWFRILSLLTAGAVLVFLVRQRIKKIKFQSEQKQLKLKQEIEKRELEKELKLKADFTAMLVHDLRNPLTAVLGYADLLKSNRYQGDRSRAAAVIFQSCQRMVTLINDMLDLSKYEAGKMKLNRSSASLQYMTKDIVQLMQPLLDQKKLTLHLDFADLADIPLDQEKIGQVMNNLLSNAIKFSPAGGRISIQTRGIKFKDDNFQEFSLTDNGPGIPEDRRQYLFDKYAQLHEPGSMKGTGLGLAVSRAIVEAHGGEIGYTPPQNSGSIFFFRLPEKA